jgi:hypothetical protein
VLLLCAMQLEQDLSNPAAPLTAAATYEDVMAMLRNTAIRWARHATDVYSLCASVCCMAVCVARHRSGQASLHCELAHSPDCHFDPRLPDADAITEMYQQITSVQARYHACTLRFNTLCTCILLQQHRPCAAGDAVRAAL